MKRLFIFFFLLISICFLNAQPCPEGYSAFQKSEYEKALKLFSDFLKKLPKDSAVNFMMGNSHLRLKNYRKAVPYFEKAIELKYQPIPNTHYLLARAYAGTNNDAQSISNLQLAAELGFSGYQRLDSVEFNAFRTTAGFKKAKQAMYENAFPCLKDPNNNKFDFWLGEWDVFVNGQKRADSKITKAMGGCAIHEDYVVLSGVYAGQSISYYDPTEKRWEQYWVGSAGDKSKYYETEKYDTDMQFLWISKNPDGTENWTRMSYQAQDENTVIQTLESSNDQGKTWVPSFSGTYKRKE